MQVRLDEESLFKAINENTVRTMLPKWLKNLQRNKELLESGRGVNEFFKLEGDKLFENIPAIVVSAGPSLDKNIDLLKEVGNKALIICVDSALKKVMELGVKPHFVVVTDAGWGDHEKHCFDDLPMSTKGIVLLMEAMSSRNVIKNWEGDIFWYLVPPVDGNSLPDVVEAEYTGGKTLGRLACGGCVSSVGFSFAKGALGCDPVIMIGLDLGYYDLKMHHAKGINVPFNKNAQELIKDVYDRNMITDQIFKAYKTWFENMVCGNFNSLFFQPVQGTFVNATEGGCLTKGFLVQTLDFALKHYCTKDHPIADIINTVVNKEAIDKRVNVLLKKRKLNQLIKSKIKDDLEKAKNHV